MNFRCAVFNGNRTFAADNWNHAASRVADRLARQAGGRTACAWTLREDSRSFDGTRRHYATTGGVPMKTPGEARVVCQRTFTIVAAESTR